LDSLIPSKPIAMGYACLWESNVLEYKGEKRTDNASKDVVLILIAMSRLKLQLLMHCC
jgi:hypothetical protein